jgi:outer membrane protein assembly factor BamB
MNKRINHFLATHSCCLALLLAISFAAQGADWPLARGDAKATGVASEVLPEKLELLWKFEAGKNGTFEATAVIVDGVVYVGSFDGNLYAIDLATGTKKWEFKTDLGFSAAAAVRDGKIIAGDADGKIYCLDLSGKELWNFDAGGEINGGPNFYKDQVLIGSQNATLYWLNFADGKKVLEYKIGDQIRSLPTVVENRAFLAGCDGKLHVINLDNASAIAAVDIKSPTGCTPAVLGDRVFFGTEGATFLGVDWRKPEVVWEYPSARQQAYRASAAATEEAIVIGGRDKQVVALDPKTGTEIWKYEARHRVDSSPVVSGNRVYFGCADGRLIALDMKTGEKVWEYEAGGQFNASPAIGNGRLVIGNTDGTLYCFGAKK